jgi:dihydrodipicolinate synthase/N-acetylneuraminate lyase
LSNVLPKNMLEARGSSAIPMTPFDDHDHIDVDVLEREIEFIVRCGSESICTPVMVSEFELLSEEERRMMIRIPIEVARGRCAVIANVAAVNTPLAVQYAEYAQKMGADCVIAMAPYARPMDFALMKRYFKAVSDAVTIPVMIQNATNNAQLSPQQVVQLCEEVQNVQYVKQEVIPGPVTITNLLALKSPAVKMVMSGYAGLFSPMDFNRGAIATIHACEFCDLVQKVWDLLYEGKQKEALDLQSVIVPALQMESLLGMTYAKEVMVRRGVFKNTRTRTKAEGLSDADKRDLDMIWPRIEPHFTFRGF